MFGCPATRNKYRAGHVQNVLDGIGGIVKRMADEMIPSGKCQIQEADEFMRLA